MNCGYLWCYCWNSEILFFWIFWLFQILIWYYGYCLMIMLQLFVITGICPSAKGQVKLCRMLTRGLLRIKGSEKWERPDIYMQIWKDQSCIKTSTQGPWTEVYIYVEYYFGEQMWRLCWDVLQLKVLIYIWARKPIGNNVASQSSSTSISFFLHVWHLSHHKTLSLSTKTSFLRTL